MKTPDPAFILHLKAEIRKLNHAILNPQTPTPEVISAAKEIKVLETKLRNLIAKAA